MKNRFLSVIIALSMIITCVAQGAFAANAFPDVLSPDHDWAAEQIEEMTDLGIIKGYTDGTFKPDKAVSKIEAMLLFSRVAGYSNSAYAKMADFANEKYQYALEEVDLGVYDSFKKELAFLIYRGIVEEEALIESLGDDKYSEPFPRGDAAVLIAGLMDAEVKKTDVSKLDFADRDEIPAEAADFIAYVVENGLMNGVEKDDGSIVFDAEKPLSRAQVCVLLYRIMNKLEMSVEAGICIKADAESGVIDFENAEGKDDSYIVSDDVKIIIDGENGKLEQIVEKSDIVIIRHGKNIYSIEAVNPVSNKTVKGTVEAVASRSNFVKLSIIPEDSNEKITYYANEEFKVTTDGVVDEFSAVQKGDFVVVQLLGTEIVSIDRQTAQATVQGIVEKISLSTPITISVLTTDETSKKETVSEYTVADDVSVRRDGDKVSLRDILVGDKVVLTIERGDVSKVVATSTKGSVTGVITALKIASQSSITISENGQETEYAISVDSAFFVESKQAAIYDLRLGSLVKLSLSGNTAIKIEQTTADAPSTKTGIVESISSSYGYINMISSSGVAEQIFVNRTGSNINVKVVNGVTAKEIAFKDIKKGDSVIATGSYSNGAFIAKTLTVIPVAE